jgi:hypothetical protein
LEIDLTLLHPPPSSPLPSSPVERGGDALATKGTMGSALLITLPLVPLPLVAVIAALVMGGSQRGMETSCHATRPPLAWRRRGTRERRGGAHAPKGTLVLLHKTLQRGLSPVV